MELRKIFTPNSFDAAAFRGIAMRGFTLIEMLIVIGLIGIVSGYSVVMGLDGLRGDSYRAERDTIVILLQQARTEALNNIDESKHGVAFFPAAHPRSYVEFAGNSYLSVGRDTSKDTVVDAQYAVAFASGSPSEVVFDQLSGNTSFSGNIVLIDTQRQFSSNMTITSEGGISW